MTASSAHDLNVRQVIRYLGLLSFTSLVILGVLALRGINPPDILIGVLASTLSGSIGALTAMLVQGASRSTTEAQDVTVVNQPSEPVPVEASPG